MKDRQDRLIRLKVLQEGVIRLKRLIRMSPQEMENHLTREEMERTITRIQEMDRMAKKIKGEKVIVSPKKNPKTSQ